MTDSIQEILEVYRLRDQINLTREILSSRYQHKLVVEEEDVRQAWRDAKTVIDTVGKMARGEEE